MTFSCSCMLVCGFSPCSGWLQPAVKQELLGTWFRRPELWLHSWGAYLCLCSEFFDLDCIFPFFLEIGLNVAPKQINHFHSNSTFIQHFKSSAFESKRENVKKGKGHINIEQSQLNGIEQLWWLQSFIFKKDVLLAHRLRIQTDRCFLFSVAVWFKAIARYCSSHILQC